MATLPSTSSPPDLDPPDLPQKKPQPVPWTHQETTHLIEAYQEKWYSLKKGQLKTSQWEEVAVTVAARCGYDEPSKTATQCRHKIEKLRKRYRSEKQRLLSNWQFFDLMDRMARGPLPISARPMAIVKCQNLEDQSDFDLLNGNEHYTDNDDDDEEEEEDDRRNNKSKSINYILRTPTIVNRFAVDRKLNSGAARKQSEAVEVEVEAEEEEEEEVEGGKRVISELAGEIKRFAERIVRLESNKMEMMRQTEKYRMEMENKRMGMILESQRKIVDTIGKALAAHKKLKVTSTQEL